MIDVVLVFLLLNLNIFHTLYLVFPLLTIKSQMLAAYISVKFYFSKQTNSYPESNRVIRCLLNVMKKYVFKDKTLYFPFTARKVSKYGVFSGPYFPVFGLNTEFYQLNLRIHSEYGKIGTRKNSVFGYLSPSDCQC